MTSRYPSWNNAVKAGRVGGVGDVHVVGSQESSEHDDVGRSGELVFGWVVRGHVYDRVDVGLEQKTSEPIEWKDGRETYERNSCKVPEDNQEAPLFMVHIPSLRNAFLTLAAGAGVSRSIRTKSQHPHQAFK